MRGSWRIACPLKMVDCRFSYLWRRSPRDRHGILRVRWLLSTLVFGPTMVRVKRWRQGGALRSPSKAGSSSWAKSAAASWMGAPGPGGGSSYSISWSSLLRRSCAGVPRRHPHAKQAVEPLVKVGEWLGPGEHPSPGSLCLLWRWFF